MVKQIAHIAIEISNLERSLEFYCGALGLEKKFEMKNNDGKVSLVYIKVSEGVLLMSSKKSATILIEKRARQKTN